MFGAVNRTHEFSLAVSKALATDLQHVLFRPDVHPKVLLTFFEAAFCMHLRCGPKVGGFQDACDLGFPRRLSRRARLADLFR